MRKWLDDFYTSETTRSAVTDSYTPIFEKYADKVWAADGGLGSAPPDFVASLVQTYVGHHLDSSRAQLQEQLAAPDPKAAIQARLAEWMEKRPSKVASNETVLTSNALALAQMREAGVKRKVWRTVGTCAFCKEMAGKTTTIEKDFVKAGDALHPAGVEVAMTITQPVGHPPLHQGCRCSVEPAEKVVSTQTPQERFGSDSTENMHKVNGEYTAERQRLHAKIQSQLLDGHVAQAERRVYLTGGGPASGKGGFIKSGRVPVDSAAVDPDAIKALLPEYQAGTEEGLQWIAAFSHEESSYLSKKIAVEATKRNLNLTLDTVGDGALDNLTHKIEALRSEGTRVVADYATIPTDLAVQRAAERAAKTGRFVPETYIRESHAAISDVLPQAVERNLFDEVRLWNTESRPPRLIMESVDGVTTIVDQGLWEEFLAKSATKTVKYSASQARVPSGSPGGGRWRGGPGPGNAALAQQGLAGGFSISKHGDVPSSGYMVSPYKGAETAIPAGEFGRDSVYNFQRKNQELLNKPDHYMGGWRDGETVYLDVSVRTSSRSVAKQIASGADQLAVYDLGTGAAISTGDL